MFSCKGDKQINNTFEICFKDNYLNFDKFQNEKFISNLKQINSEIIIVSFYKNQDESIKVVLQEVYTAHQFFPENSPFHFISCQEGKLIMGVFHQFNQINLISSSERISIMKKYFKGAYSDFIKDGYLQPPVMNGEFERKVFYLD